MLSPSHLINFTFLIDVISLPSFYRLLCFKEFFRNDFSLKIFLAINCASIYALSEVMPVA